ncbi:alpha/beta fold hydrolase [Streptomyces flavofungini]|uniref:Alpha/beta hydrolase n=1 Tax=Streptomyces flavofungini TaxID=68200 RepID=A0ABS0XCE8_9ACTN|nr:alpha/beta hydrolase [Streptomyces flavofungini]MBJ3810855.1 alpha/beta hydrolase [Streptomyces flavofungini]GHC62603.1 dehalogenase [Streptomyces flavofungini]
MTDARLTDTELARSLAGDFTSAHADVNGTRLHYVTGGSGEPLVLLGGWPQTWWQFHKIMPTLARRYRVIAVDLRGMGGSAKPESGYDKKTMARDVRDLVRHLGHDSAHLVGHDIGAMVAYAHAANHPEATRKVALLDVAHPDENLRKFPLLPAVEAGTDWETAPGIYLWWFAFNQVKGLPEQLLDGRMGALSDWLFGYLLKDQSSIDAHSRAVYAAAYSTPDAVRAGNAWYQTFRQDVADFATYEPVRTPLLGLAGERNLAYLRETLARHGTDAVVRAVPDSGHYLPEEQPEFVTGQLVEFFG